MGFEKFVIEILRRYFFPFTCILKSNQTQPGLHRRNSSSRVDGNVSCPFDESARHNEDDISMRLVCLVAFERGDNRKKVEIVLSTCVICTRKFEIHQLTK